MLFTRTIIAFANNKGMIYLYLYVSHILVFPPTIVKMSFSLLSNVFRQHKIHLSSYTEFIIELKTNWIQNKENGTVKTFINVQVLVCFN